MTSQEINEREWQNRIKHFLNSGLPRQEYCKQHDINQQSLLYWLGRHYEASSNMIPARVTNKPVNKAASSSSLCNLELANGLKVSITDKSILSDELSAMVIELAKLAVSPRTNTVEVK